jgi:transcriptional regulator
MYIPRFNLTKDRSEIVGFMKRFGFATVVNVKEGLPIATHLPVAVTTDGDDIVLTSHFARANEQWMCMEQGRTLVIFSEPHAYISTAHYDSPVNVPTWNYISVHAYGKACLLTETDRALQVLDRVIEHFDPSYRSQWESLPEGYRMKMLKGIVAFEVRVDDLQGKKKLSQNRSEAEQERIMESLGGSTDTNEAMISEYMRLESGNLG